ncbi:MAG: sodium:solute symporter family protein [Planctomycetia bacterium]|nr:sodium:solute symporter family protein [Planctomycetia bacterium]
MLFYQNTFRAMALLVVLLFSFASFGQEATQTSAPAPAQTPALETTPGTAAVPAEARYLHMDPLDIWIIALFFLSTLSITCFTMRRAGKSSSEFFLSGRSMPWWLLGFSLVATTFAADTPNLVTQLVRQNGVSGNWVWWAFLPTGMTTVFIYAALWRRLGVMTDLEFYEQRYSGNSAAFVRGFRTLYLGLIVNTIIMANVTLAIVKILGVMLGLPPIVTLLCAGTVTVLFTTAGGFSAVLWADFVLFLVSMFGAVAAAVVVLQLPEVGGLHGLVTHPAVVDKLSFFPDFTDTSAVVSLLVIPLVVQWWSAWYPGAEPGGGSYTAQRMLAAKNESNAVGATLFFNICHYAVRPWPWILVALASLIVFPSLDSLKTAFPTLPENMIKDDMAYPAMMTKLPAGYFGIVVASLFAAYMSTVATHLNLGASYMVNDFYKRFVNQKASEKRMVLAGRLWTVGLMILACVLAMFIDSAQDSFNIILMVGAGTGLLFLLRWFWWRINAWSEIAAMCISFPVALYFQLVHEPLWRALIYVENAQGEQILHPSLDFSDGIKLVLSVAVTTVGWIIVTYLTKPTDQSTLRKFLEKTQAGGPGWRHVVETAEREGKPIRSDGRAWSVPMGLLCSVLGCMGVYAALFAVGAWLYGRWASASILTGVACVGGLLLYFAWRFVPVDHSTYEASEMD